MSWSELRDWWVGELAGDPAYEEVVTPLLVEILEPDTSYLYLDVGCGEGRVMRTLRAMGVSVHGLDSTEGLVASADRCMVADLARIPVRSRTYDGVYSVLTLEHVAEEDLFFREAARVTRPGGVLALIVNHPIWTAPGSTPILDTDGETLWRPGDYFSRGESEVPAGDSKVTFHHRPMADLLNSAAAAGWRLQRMIEQPHHEFEDQAGIPRLMACRWLRGNIL